MSQQQQQQQLSTSSGKAYKLDKYKFNTKEEFCEKCRIYNENQEFIALEIHTIHTNAQITPWRCFDEVICLHNRSIAERIQRMMMINQNFHIIFKNNGIKYSLVSVENNEPFIQWIIKEAKNLKLHLLGSRKKYRLTMRTLNQGIREADLFIEIMNNHMAFNREKMITLLPRLMGHRIDANIATIIYDYCM